MFHRSFKFRIVIIFKNDKVSLNIGVVKIFGYGEITACYVFVPMSKLPRVSVGISLYHTLVNDIGRCFHPYCYKLCVLFGELCPETANVVHIPYFTGKRRIDKNDVVIIESLKSQRNNAVVFIIADIILKELTASVIWLICGGKYLL